MKGLTRLHVSELLRAGLYIGVELQREQGVLRSDHSKEQLSCDDQRCFGVLLLSVLIGLTGGRALYARVSTLNHKQDPELQLFELRDYVARRGWIIASEYVEHGISGTKESRPALNRLMADAQQRKFDAVLVWKIDRFGRSLIHLVNALADLAAVGVAFISLRDNLDLSTCGYRKLRPS